MKPLVSIILPTFNRAKTIEKAIKSVLNQSYFNFELVIVDDASQDNTSEIIRGINDPRIKYLKHTQNLGGAAARNTGIKNSSGKFIGFQDSDDEWLLGKLEKQVSILENGNEKIGAVYGGYFLWDGRYVNYFPNYEVNLKNRHIYPQILEYNWIGTPTLLVKRECFEVIGLFDETLPRYQDWDLVIRISKNYEIIFLEGPVLIANILPSGITKNEESNIIAREIILKKYFESLVKFPKFLSKHYYYLGNLKCINKSTKEGRSLILKAIKINPFKIVFIFAWILSFLGRSNYRKVVSFKRVIKKVGFQYLK